MNERKPCKAVAQKRRGKKAAEWSVRCECGTYQTPWRISRTEVARLYGDHVVDRMSREHDTDTFRRD